MNGMLLAPAVYRRRPSTTAITRTGEADMQLLKWAWTWWQAKRIYAVMKRMQPGAGGDELTTEANRSAF